MLAIIIYKLVYSYEELLLNAEIESEGDSLKFNFNLLIQHLDAI